MHHLHYEVDAEAGDVVDVSLDRAANVQLFDPPNYERYRTGQDCKYRDGGYATVTPVQLEIPEAGRWHVVIDLGGGPGHVRASVRILTVHAASLSP